MKTLISKLFAAIICIFTFGNAFAQGNFELEEKTLPVGEFTSVSVDDGFEVNLLRGPQNVKVTAYRDLMPYVQVYVRSKVLYITYDEKSVPKDIKKLFKGGRGSTEPIFRAVITVPELSGITLSNNATLSSSDDFSTNRFDLALGDKAQVKSLNIEAASVTLSMKKNAQAVVNITAEKKLEVNTEGNANLKLSGKAEEIQLNAAGSSDWALVLSGESANVTTAGSSEVILNLKTRTAALQTSGTSKLNLSGETESLSVQGERSSQVDANGFTANYLDANLSGNSKVNVAVKDSLSANLIGGSALYYTGTPKILLGKVIKSTLAPYGSTAK